MTAPSLTEVADEEAQTEWNDNKEKHDHRGHSHFGYEAKQVTLGSYQNLIYRGNCDAHHHSTIPAKQRTPCCRPPAIAKQLVISNEIIGYRQPHN